MPTDDLGSIAILACRAGMAALVEAKQRSRAVTQKGSRLDIVTDADLASEEAIVSAITTHRPNDGVRSEETVNVEGSSGIRWEVDPLDSTANYARGIPVYSVSVAVLDADGPLAAAIGDPERDVIYSSSRGSGAVRHNDVVVEPEHPGDPRRAVALFGLGPRTTPEHPRTAVVPAVLLDGFGKVRSPGSPALGLAWVAAGLADLAYYEMDFNEWDVSAGMLLCHEAGLLVIRARPLAADLSPRLLAGVPALVAHVATTLGMDC